MLQATDLTNKLIRLENGQTVDLPFLIKAYSENKLLKANTRLMHKKLNEFAILGQKMRDRNSSWLTKGELELLDELIYRNLPKETRPLNRSLDRENR